MYRLGANYHMPFVYPDAGIGNIVYFLRVRGNFFFDYTRVFSNNLVQTRDFRSAGLELFFDTKWWTQQPVNFGIRYSRLLDDDLYRINANQFEFILPINLLGR